jgi:hypothetical protein
MTKADKARRKCLAVFLISNVRSDLFIIIQRKSNTGINRAGSIAE